MGFISGIQQVGVGCSDATKTFAWLKKAFGLDVKIFDDAAKAPLMTKYTGGQIHERRAILALNMNGGGGTEIWQFTSRQPTKGKNVQWGDLGINAVKLKSNDVSHSYTTIGQSVTCSEPKKDPANNNTFFIPDETGNMYQMVKDDSWFKKDGVMNGGVCGAIIGVKHMDTSLRFYRKGLGIEYVEYDLTGTFDDMGDEYKDQRFRRVLLRYRNPEVGAFSRLFGDVQIELIQNMDQKGEKLFENRYWGDLGFIHLCFDVDDMEKLKTNLESQGYHFTVDSGDTFDMGESGGRFAYVEDPDGTLIEMVETHKVPILKKLGIYINLKKRKKQKPLPDWLVGMLSIHKVK
jgi:catechol 2,3-dioxygenase-like lactoylglutathione lyase family enzyme